MSTQTIRDAQAFLILGAAKCGTTSFYRYLDQHPDLLFSSPKEPIFFEAEYERGLDHYWSACYADWAGQPVIGEGRTHNLMLPYVPARIHESLPDARLVVLVRDPVDRAYSHWWHRYSRSLERMPFRQALDANLERIQRGVTYEGEAGAVLWRRGLVKTHDNYATRDGHYLELGRYAEQIERYLALFSSSQLEVIFFEDLSEDPLGVTRKAWKFVGLDATQALGDTSAHNRATEFLQSPLRYQLGRIAGRASVGLSRAPQLKRLVPASLGRTINRVLTGKQATRPPMTDDDERWLLEYYEPQNRALEQLAGRPLPHWFVSQRHRTAC